MIDIVTVVCTRDKLEMQLQAHTMNMFLSDSCVHYVVIEDNDTSYGEWLTLLLPHYTRHQLKLVHDFNFKSLPGVLNSGYVRQQQIKLLMANYVHSEYYMILDTKNIFFKPLHIKDIPIVHGNKAICNIKDAHIKEYNGWYDFVCNMFGFDMPQQVPRAMTPFILDTQIVRSILGKMDVTEILKRVRLPDLLPYREPSEFLLYSIYVYNKMPAVFNKEYNAPDHYTWFPDFNDADQTATMFEDVENNKLIIGFHRLFIQNHKDKALECYNWLLTKGIKKEYLNPVFLIDKE